MTSNNHQPQDHKQSWLKTKLHAANHSVDRHLEGQWRRPVQVATVVIGFVVIIVGLALVPLPGPGWLIVFAGLAILAKVFPPAERLVGWIQHKVEASTQWAKQRLSRQ